MSTAEVMEYILAPDFAGGGQIITPKADLQHIYETGRGSIRVRACYEIEKLARSQWRVIVTQLPPNASAQKVLAEVEEQINPKPKTGKKQLNQDQLNTKKLMLDLLEKVRDESDGDSPVRLVFEPKSSRIEPQNFINTLMAQTSLEGNVSMNLVMMGLDNRPAQKNLATILQEWLDFRVITVTRRLEFRLAQVEKRIHILNGRMIAFLHIDAVIAVIREAEDPKTELMAAFNLSEIQAEDILEIRLRQLARLEGFKLENELNALREEQGQLNDLLTDEAAKKRKIIKEMQEDLKKFGDERRTLVQEAERATLTQTTADEPITLILSKKGWIRSRAGHNIDFSQTSFKEGDGLQQILEGRTIQPVIVLDSHGRSYTLDAAEIPGGRGEGVPVSSLIELQNNAKVVSILTGDPQQHYVLANSSAYGFIVKLSDMVSRIKTGKVLMTLEQTDTLLPPVPVYAVSLIKPETKLVLASSANRLLSFALGELKVMTKGRGLQLMSLSEQESLMQMVVVLGDEFIVESIGKRGAVHTERLRVQDIHGKRGRKGKVLEITGHLKALRCPD